MFAICPYSTAALRSQPNHTSELLSQLLFGEMVEILETKGKKWVKIRHMWDHGIGWMERSQLTGISPEEYSFFKNNFSFSLDLFSPIMDDSRHLPIVLGSRLPDFDGLRLKLNGNFFHYSGQALHPDSLPRSADFLIKLAKRYLGAPYLHGGRTPLGIDGPGLVQMLYMLIGVKIPRTAEQQSLEGELVDFAEQAETGDLAFFENSKGIITDVGMLLNNKEIIYVNGCVKINSLDHFGIFDGQNQKYTQRLRIIRRITPRLDPSTPVTSSGQSHEITSDSPAFT